MKVVIPTKRSKLIKKLKAEVYLLKSSFKELSEESIEKSLTSIQAIVRELEQKECK
jgi:hypothetical protein